MKSFIYSYLLLIVAVSLLLTSCATGTTRVNPWLEQGIHRIYIKPVESHSPTPDTYELTNRANTLLRQELRRMRSFTIVENVSEADAILTGYIIDFSIVSRTYLFNETQPASTEYVGKVIYKYEIVRANDGAVLFDQIMYGVDRGNFEWDPFIGVIRRFAGIVKMTFEGVSAYSVLRGDVNTLRQLGVETQ